MFTKIIFCVMFILCLSASYAQDAANIKFGKVVAADFQLVSPLIDSNTSAVIIADIGTTTFSGNDKGWFSYLFKRKKRIKLLRKQAFDLATIEIPLYQKDESSEKLSDLTAVTYTLENGQVKEAKLDKKDLFEEKLDKNHIVKKFTFPSLMEGSIIEYSYTIRSDFEFNLPSWEFQHFSHPTLWSEYSVTIPTLLVYTFISQGPNDFFIDKTEDGRGDYMIKRQISEGRSRREETLNVSVNTIKRRWVVKDRQPVGSENYLTSAQNYIDKLDFQLSKTHNGENYLSVADSWGKVTRDLMTREDFGKTLDEPQDFITEIVKPLTVGNSTLQDAKNIFAYVRDNFTCTNHYNKFIKTSLKDVVKTKTGNVGEINLLLTALLKAGNISAAPVLLSTREFGRNYPKYPMLQQFNYVVCRATIDGTDYYLDATDPYLGFGKLPLYCYNGHARVISSDSSAVYFSADALKEKKFVNVTIANATNMNFTGTYINNAGYYQSTETRKKIAAISLEKYQKELAEQFPKEITLNNITVDSLKERDGSIIIKYDLDLKTAGEDIIYFNPLFGESMKKNPFAAATRHYPVEMPYAPEEIYTLSLEIPKGYRIEELPKSEEITLKSNQGIFNYQVSNNNGKIQLKRILKLEKATYGTGDYQALRDFYTFVIKKDNEQIVFKKIK